jgi:tetratricopeptide (TPR) repeat protein
MSETDEARDIYEAARIASVENRHGDAIAGFQQIVDRFEDTSDDWLDWLVGHALYGKAQSLERIERDDEAERLYTQIVERFGDSEAEDRPRQVARALIHRSSALSRLGRDEEAIEVSAELIARYGDSDVPFLIGYVSRALERKAASARKLDRLDDAIDAYDEIIVRFTDSEFPPMRRQADIALSNKAFVLMLDGRIAESIVVANAAVARLDHADAPAELALAVLNLGGALAQEDRLDEAMTLLDTLIDRLGGDETAELRTPLILAISNKVELLSMMGRSDDAVALHTELVQRFGERVPQAFGEAAARNEHDEGAAAVVAGMLLKQAMVLAELDHIAASKIALDNLINRFGDGQGDDIERVMGMARDFRAQLDEEDEEEGG